MAAKDAQTILNEIVAHINKQGGPASSWYAGITSDIDQRLFNAHRVPRQDHWFVYREGFTTEDVRAVEAALIKFGCDGGRGGGDDSATLVYAYLKTSVTDP